MHERNAEGAFGRFAGFVDPDAAYRLGGCRQVHGRDEWQSLRRCEALDTVHPSALLPGIVLGHPAHRESFCAPGCREQLLESAGVPGLSTGRCWIDSSWELEASSLELAPGDRLPCIPMRRGARPHSKASQQLVRRRVDLLSSPSRNRRNYRLRWA
jgi:hypothetical protein